MAQVSKGRQLAMQSDVLLSALDGYDSEFESQVHPGYISWFGSTIPVVNV